MLNARSRKHSRDWFKDPSKKLPPAEKIIDDLAVHLGHLYRSGALIPEEGLSLDDAFEDPRNPTGRPGSRAPHIMIEREGEKLSTIDLYSGQWTLLAGPEGASWCNAVSKVPAASAVGLRCYRIGTDVNDANNRWSATYGVDVDGATLIRPDGFIAWRAKNASSEPEAVLRDVFAHLGIYESSTKQRSQSSTGKV